MTLRLLLDAHFGVRFARALHLRTVDTEVLDTWRNGAFRHQTDRAVLAAAYSDGRVLVTCDVHTIPALLTTLADENVHHGGVIFVAQRTVQSGDVGGIARALATLAQRAADLGLGGPLPLSLSWHVIRAPLFGPQTISGHLAFSSQVGDISWSVASYPGIEIRGGQLS